MPVQHKPHGAIRSKAKFKNTQGVLASDRNMAEEKFYISKEESAQLRQYCLARSMTISGLVRNLVLRWMQKQKEVAMDRERERARLRELDEAIARADALNLP